MNTTNTSDAAAGGGLAFVGLLFILIGVGLYLLPGIIASLRKHPQAVAIWVLDVLLGWTMLGWIGALVWSLTNSERTILPVPVTVSQMPNSSPTPPSITDEITSLAKLRDQGLLTEEEFTARKRKLLGDSEGSAPTASAI